MLSWHSHIDGSSGKLARRWRLICCGLHRCASSSRDQLAQLGVGVDAALVAAGPAGGRLPVGVERAGSRRPAVALRRSSREIVEGARPSRRAICRMLRPCVAQVGDLDPLVLGQVPGADLADGQPVQRLARTRRPGRGGRSCSRGPSCSPVVRETPTSRAAATDAPAPARAAP